MKIREIITETKKGKMTKRQQQPTKGVNVYRDAQRANTDYVGFKLGQAMAMTDGSFVPDIDAESWYGKQKTVQPYSKEEQEMFIKAAKAVGAKYKDLNKGDMKSKELDSTNTVSPVAKPKRNKYGI